MLVLSRKHGERILIDRDIVITVIKVERHVVRIGIEAPPEVKIFREEIANIPGPRTASAPLPDIVPAEDATPPERYRDVEIELPFVGE